MDFTSRSSRLRPFAGPIRHRRLIAPLVAVAVGCESPTQPDPAFDPAIVTDGTVFTVESAPLNPTNPTTFRQGTISHTFTNRTGARVYVRNCGGEFEMVLERKVGGNWEPFWYSFPPGCLSPALVLEPGETHSATLLVYGFPRDSCCAPELAPAPGPFRIRWADALVSSFEWGPPTSWGDPIPEKFRISNEFELVFE